MESATAVAALTALAHEGRLAIFRLLVRRAPGEAPAGEIALALGVRGSTLSNQLNELERAGLVQSRRNGRSILYRAQIEAAGDLIRFLAVDCCKGRPEACPPIAEAFAQSPQSAASRWGGGLQKASKEGALDPKTMDPTGLDQEDLEMNRIYNVLFLCVGNSARSIFAEAILSRVGMGKFKAYSAGSSPRGALHPRAAALLTHINYDVSGLRSKSWDEFAAPGAPALDFVFTVCDKAANEVCPVWPGQPMSAHWGVPDPAGAMGDDAEIGLAFSEAYRLLYNRIGAFANLPIDGLDRLALQERLDDIGRGGADDRQFDDPANVAQA